MKKKIAICTILSFSVVFCLLCGLFLAHDYCIDKFFDCKKNPPKVCKTVWPLAKYIFTPSCNYIYGKKNRPYIEDSKFKKFMYMCYFFDGPMDNHGACPEE